MSFQHLNLIEPVLRAVKTEGYTTPTPIQAQAIPHILERKDVLGSAQTGTGKTAAFAIPILQLMAMDKKNPKTSRKIKSLILTPTRELAIQIGESFERYGRYTPLKYRVVFGGVNQHAQVQSLKSGIDILIATPGRLLDLMQQGYIDLASIEYFVLDEADRMLDMGFINDVKKVIAKLPARRQSLFFSATMPQPIIKLADTILHNPVKLRINPESTTADKIDQVVYFVDKKNKRSLLKTVLQDRLIKRALVFTRTKHGADRVTRELNKAGIRALAIHGNKSQNARQAALLAFKKEEIRILVATDIAARGIDIDYLTHVINFELPNIAESYVHRIGRTARAGETGSAIAFCDAEEKEYLYDIQKLIGKKVAEVKDHSFPLTIHNVVKEVRQPRQPAGKNDSGRQKNKNGNASADYSPAKSSRRRRNNSFHQKVS